MKVVTEDSNDLVLQDTMLALIRDIVERRGISQKAISVRLGCSERHMSSLMTGKTPITLDWAERIARICGQRIILTSRRVNVDRIDFSSKR